MQTLSWHFDYDVSQPPPKPSAKGHVRFVFLSDTHSTQPPVPDGDVLFHSGDLTDMGSTKSFEDQLAWLASLPHAHKFIIAGNHDFGACTRDNWYERVGRGLHAKYAYATADTDKVRKALDAFEAVKDKQHRYLEDEAATFELAGKAWTVYGSPWSPIFGGWAWNYERGSEAEEVFKDVPENVDILLTHSPPHTLGNLDVLTDGKTHVGCEVLRDKMVQGTFRPLIHAFGHIHEAWGTHAQKWDEEGDNETLLINAAVVEFDMDVFIHEKKLHYNVVHPPIIVDLDVAQILKQGQSRPAPMDQSGSRKL